MRVRKALIVSCFAVLCAMGATLLAQDSDNFGGARPPGGGADGFGVTDGNDLWIPASQFVAEGSSVGHWPFILSGTDYNIGVNGHVYAYAPVPLPQGALVDGWDAIYYDNSATYNIQVEFFKVYGDITNAPTMDSLVLGNFASSGTPGFATHHDDSGHTIDFREPAPGSSVTRDQAVDGTGST